MPLLICPVSLYLVLKAIRRLVSNADFPPVRNETWRTFWPAANPASRIYWCQSCDLCLLFFPASVLIWGHDRTYQRSNSRPAYRSVLFTFITCISISTTAFLTRVVSVRFGPPHTTFIILRSKSNSFQSCFYPPILPLHPCLSLSSVRNMLLIATIRPWHGIHYAKAVTCWCSHAYFL